MNQENDTKQSGHGEHEEHKLSFWRQWVFSTDHKVIGIQYGVTGLFFLLFGFGLVMVMRWTIAYPNDPSWIGYLVEQWNSSWATDGKMNGEFYNMFGAMHGTIMIFLGFVPIAFGAFANYVVPLQIGAPDMAFPKLNMMSYWSFFIGCVLMVASFFVPTGAVQTGWTMYPPFANLTDIQYPNPWLTGQTWWILSMVFIISSSLLGSLNVITTIINLRAKGMTWMRMPFLTWSMLVTAFIMLLAFPPIEVAALMQLSDRVFSSSFFSPSGLVVNGAQVTAYSGGGSPLLYQHLFWFLGHPEVYVLVLPVIAISTEVLVNNTRKSLWGYKTMVYSVLALGFLSFVVWAHHMYLTGMGPFVSSFFQTTTMIISIPSVILISCLLVSLWGGSIRFTMPMLWVCAFLPFFGIGGLTGLPLAFNFTDLYLHDTYYVIGHFHYVIAPAGLSGIFAGVYYWYPKVTGRMMGKVLGHLHFWPTVILMNVIFVPMFIQGMAGFHRRWWDGGESFRTLTRQEFNFFGLTETLLDLNVVTTWGTYALGAVQIFFIFNFFGSLFFGKRIKNDNPWDATTLEWSTPTPPPHGNFTKEPVVHRAPYDYSIPGAKEDFCPCDKTDAELGIKKS